MEVRIAADEPLSVMGWLAVPLVLSVKLPEYMPSAMAIVCPGLAEARAERRPSVVETEMFSDEVATVDGAVDGGEPGAPELAPRVGGGDGEVPVTSGWPAAAVAVGLALNGNNTCGVPYGLTFTGVFRA